MTARQQQGLWGGRSMTETLLYLGYVGGGPGRRRSAVGQPC